MKRIFFLIILAAAHLASSAQTNPKIERLYNYLKDQGITKSYRLGNIDGNGLRKRFDVYLNLYDESLFIEPQSSQYDIDSILNHLPGAGVDSEGNRTINGKKVKNLMVDGKAVSLEGKVSVKTVESKVDSAYRAKAIAYREAYEQIRNTINELQVDAAESYSYEYHQNGADTIITTMALKNAANNNTNIHSYRGNSNLVTQVASAPERIYFNYKNIDRKSTNNSPYSPVGYFNFQYDGIVDSTLEATKDFDVVALKKKLDPIFKNKNIKRHELLCRHDATFDRNAYNDSLTRIGQYKKRIQEMTTGTLGPGGESHYTIYKITNEEQARSILKQVLECVCQQIKADPVQAYSVMPDADFSTNILFGDIFSAYPCPQTIQDYYEGKRKSVEMFDIKTYMDPDGFYIILNVHQGDNTFPYEWKSLKEFVNGKKVYYKDSL